MRDFCSSLKCGNVKKSFPHFHKAQEPYLEGARVCVSFTLKKKASAAGIN